MWNKSSVTWQLFALRLLYIKGVMSRYADVEMSVNPKDHGAKGPNKGLLAAGFSGFGTCCWYDYVTRVMLGIYSCSARRRPTSPQPLLSIPASHLISSPPYPRFPLSIRLSTMELYMYTPPVYMAPIRPLVKPAPSVPIVKEGPIPELFQAPEGEYNLADPGSVFPVLGNTSPNIASELRLTAQPGPFLGGPGFGLPPTPQQTSPSAASASSTSFGATLINGKWEPIYPTRMSWVMVQIPSKIGDRGFGGLLGKGGKSDTAAFLPPAAADGRYPTKSSYSSSSSSSSPVPSEPQSVPFAMSPPTTQSKWPFAKSINGIPRPKTSMRNSTSDFVQRVIGLDSASKYLAEKGKTVSEVVKWGCWHMGKQWAWADFGKQANEADKKSKVRKDHSEKWAHRQIS